MTIQLVKYRVGFKQPGKTDCDLWWPKGGSENCDADKALQRYDHVVARMKSGKRIERCRIEYVFIQRVADGEIMIGEWPDGFQIGPWAAKGAAA